MATLSRTRLTLKLSRLLWLLLLLPLLARAGEITSFSFREDLPREAVRSGLEFLTPATRALQEDSFENPGYLWVARLVEALLRLIGETELADRIRPSQTRLESSDPDTDETDATPDQTEPDEPPPAEPTEPAGTQPEPTP